jgi:hypothetical protein
LGLERIVALDREKPCDLPQIGGDFEPIFHQKSGQPLSAGYAGTRRRINFQGLYRYGHSDSL